MVQYPRHAVVEFHPDWAIKSWHCVLCGSQCDSQEQLKSHLQIHEIKDVIATVITTGNLPNGASINFKHSFITDSTADVSISTGDVAAHVKKEINDSDDYMPLEEVESDNESFGAKLEPNDDDSEIPEFKIEAVHSDDNGDLKGNGKFGTNISQSQHHQHAKADQFEKLKRYKLQRNKPPTINGFRNNKDKVNCSFFKCTCNPCLDCKCPDRKRHDSKFATQSATFKNDADAVAFLANFHMNKNGKVALPVNQVYRSATSRVAYPRCLAKTVVTLVHDQPIFRNTADINSTTCLCNKCQMPFHCYQTMMWHMKNVHSEEHFKCRFCQQEFTNAFDMDSHITFTHFKSVLNSKATSVATGRKRVKRKASSDLQEMHLERKTPSLAVRLPNKDVVHSEANLNMKKEDTPKETTDTASVVINDQERNSLINGNKYVCSTCGKSYKLKNRHLSHMNYAHGTILHHCHFCVESFLTNIELQAHLNSHTAKEFKCGICQKDFSTEADLKHHEKSLCRSKLETALKLKTDVSKITDDKMQSAVGKLEVEFKSIKKDEIVFNSTATKRCRKSLKHNNFKCSKCPKMCSSRKQLKKHEDLEHAEFIPFKCRRCGSSYASFMELHLHVANVHQEVHEKKEK